MEKLYISIEANNANAAAIIEAHIGKTIAELRTALKARFKYDPVGRVCDDEHEERLRQMGKTVIAVSNDGTVRHA